MKFTNRETEFPGKRKLIKVDEYNIPVPGEAPVLVNIIKDEGRIDNEGTPITADNLSKGNWRDDDSLSFQKSADSEPPQAKDAETQIITTSDGETWIVPPAGSGEAIRITNSIGTVIKVNGNKLTEIDFTSDPKTQIENAKNTADAANIIATAAQGTANNKSIVKVNGTKADVNFTSDPQAQIDSKADQTAADSISQDLGDHVADKNNPHCVTKAQIGLGNADNTSDISKPISTAQQAALDGKIDKVTTVTTNEQLYCKGANGAQVMRDISSSVVNSAVPVRQSNGHIAVPALPSAGADAASKQYVDSKMSGVRKWVEIYDIKDHHSNTAWDQNIGVRCDGTNTGSFVNSDHPTIGNSDVFRVYMRDYRNSRAHSVDEIAFRYNNEAYTSVHHAEQDGLPYLLRTFFLRQNNTTVHIRQHAARVSSAGVTDWYNEGDNRRIVRIEKEVPL